MTKTWIKWSFDDSTRRQDIEFLESVKAEVATMPRIPTLAEVHEVMSKIPGSMVEDFVAERED
jgi:hypothetical protein